MTQNYAKLSPLALGGGFAAAALIGMILSFLPMQFSMAGAHGYGMMNGGGYGWGFGFTFLICISVLITSAIAGAITAAVYNSLLPRESHRDVDRAAKAH